MNRINIVPTPTEEEAAAIVAVLRTLEKAPQPAAHESRWKLAGRQYDEDIKAPRR